jgi:hypothetical protein
MVPAVSLPAFELAVNGLTLAAEDQAVSAVIPPVYGPAYLRNDLPVGGAEPAPEFQSLKLCVVDQFSAELLERRELPPHRLQPSVCCDQPRATWHTTDS